MKFQVPMARSTALGLIEKAIDDGGLKDAIQMSTIDDDLFVVTILRMGTSKITIRNTSDEDHTLFEVVKEELAFTHKPLRGAIMAKLLDVVTENGGSVL